MKGLTILSEILLAVTVIAITVILAMVASGAIGGQIQSIFQQQERGFVQEIDTYIEQTRTASGEIAVTYSPSVSDYSIRVQNQTVEIEVKNDITTYRPLISVENTEGRISDADNLCFNKTEQTLRIQEGGCDKQIDEDLCENGCGPNVCRPDLGEDCTNLGCNYPEDAENPQASSYCKPEYDPGYMDEGDPTVGIGWVNEDYVGSQQEGDRCETNWECDSGLKCGSGTGSQSHCCPSNTNWNGTACEEPEDKLKIVFVPLNQNTNRYDTAVEEQGNFLKNNLPLKSCKDHINIVKMNNVCSVSLNCNDKTAILDDIRNCVTSSGINDFDYISGIFQQNVCDGTAGWSDGAGGEPVFVSQSNSKIIPAHEIGHEFGLNDEYLDTCRYGSHIETSEGVRDIVVNDNSNCLEESYDGDRGVIPRDTNGDGVVDDLDYPNNYKYCAGGTQDPNQYSIFCAGNLRSGGSDSGDGRAIMGGVGIRGPRGYSEPSYNWLKQKDELKCPGGQN